MDIMELGALGELVGAIASLVLLGYIALQLRENTRATEAASRQSFAEEDLIFLNTALDPSVIARGLAKTTAGEELSPLERSQLIERQHLNFRIMEHAHYQLLDDTEWDRYHRIVQFAMRENEYARAMFELWRPTFNPRFLAYVEAEIPEELR